MKFLNYILATFCVFVLAFANAQTSDQQLASQYFQDGEYEKAILYFKKFYNKQPSDYYYNYLYKSFLQLEYYDDAEKLVKKQLKRNKSNVKYFVDLGFVYEKNGDGVKSEKSYQKAIKDVRANRNAIIQLAKSFTAIGENEYALQTYQKGRKIMKGQYPFNVEIAAIYGTLRRYEDMIKEYLDLLEISEGYIQQVQNSLNRSMSFEKRTKQNNILKIELLKRIQKHPGKSIYAQLLIWEYIQLKDFHSAFTQMKALDKRYKEDGGRIYSLANICRRNKEYDTAVEAYEYIIAKGRNNHFFELSKMNMLSTLNEKITSSPNYTDADLKLLESKYYQAINELGRNKKTMPLYKELALLQAYYMHNTDTAMYNLEVALATPAIQKPIEAELKLVLGDLLLIKGEVWDAALYYAQVDKDFKYDQLGERAKLKTAKIHYYTGNFKFAKGMLDVLKGSTTKLIANDAMELSILITDNSTVDTTTVPLQLFATADLLSVQNKDSLALLTLDSITEIYPGHALDDEILFKKYEIAYKNRDYENAVLYLEIIVNSYSYDILADNALYQLANLYETVYTNKEKALELYEKLLLEYTGSLYTVEARKRFRKLRGDHLEAN